MRKKPLVVAVIFVIILIAGVVLTVIEAQPAANSNPIHAVQADCTQTHVNQACPEATATYGASQLHVQLTAIAGQEKPPAER